MKKLLLFAIILGATPAISQETEMQKLVAEKASLEQKIAALEDSLEQITLKIDALKSNEPKKEPIKKYSLGPNELMASEKLQLRSEPDLDSKVVLELEKQVPLLKIDQIGNFYLVCYKGTCGYAPRALLEKNTNGKMENEESNASNS